MASAAIAECARIACSMTVACCSPLPPLLAALPPPPPPQPAVDIRTSTWRTPFTLTGHFPRCNGTLPALGRCRETHRRWASEVRFPHTSSTLHFPRGLDCPAYTRMPLAGSVALAAALFRRNPLLRTFPLVIASFQLFVSLVPFSFSFFAPFSFFIRTFGSLFLPAQRSTLVPACAASLSLSHHSLHFNSQPPFNVPKR